MALGDGGTSQRSLTQPAPDITSEQALARDTHNELEAYLIGQRETIDTCDERISQIEDARSALAEARNALELRRNAAQAALDAMNVAVEAPKGMSR